MISLKFTGNIPYSALITHMKYLSGTRIGLAARSKTVKITQTGDPYAFAEIHRKHPMWCPDHSCDILVRHTH